MENLDDTTDDMMGNWGKQTSWMVFGENEMLVWELIDVGGGDSRGDRIEMQKWNISKWALNKTKYFSKALEWIIELFEETITLFHSASQWDSPTANQQ